VSLAHAVPVPVPVFVDLEETDEVPLPVQADVPDPSDVDGLAPSAQLASLPPLGGPFASLNRLLQAANSHDPVPAPADVERIVDLVQLGHLLKVPRRGGRPDYEAIGRRLYRAVGAREPIGVPLAIAEAVQSLPEEHDPELRLHQQAVTALVRGISAGIVLADDLRFVRRLYGLRAA
jgi:hypothetical protein